MPAVVDGQLETTPQLSTNWLVLYVPGSARTTSPHRSGWFGVAHAEEVEVPLLLSLPVGDK
jgi:hypothetical protein